MQKLTFILSKSKAKFPIIGWLILLCERSNFSHASIRAESSSLNRGLNYQASGSAVNFMGDVLFNLEHEAVEQYEFMVSDEAKKALLQWAIDECGKPYGRLALVGLGIQRILKLAGIKVKNPFASGNSAYVCCKLVAAALQQLGYTSSQPLDDMDLLDTKAFIVECHEKQNQL